MTKEIMDIKGVAQYLSFSHKKIYILVKERKIPFVRIGGQYRFVKGEIDSWLKNQAHETKGKINLPALKNMPDTLEKRLIFAGLLTEELLKYNLKPIIVGGNAVEFYTFGSYVTGDIDIIFADDKKLNEVLTGWGFIKEGRHWINKEYDLLIESPSDTLSGSLNRIAEVEIKGLRVYLIGIEDIIIDRLNAYVHWRSKEDGRWAREMILLNKKKIDWKYLRKRAREDKVIDALKELRYEKI